MENITRIKLFLSSPGDAKDARDAAERVINEINKEGIKEKFHIYVYRWETDFTTTWGKYQENINPELEDTDIFVGILWNRFGTPTVNFGSGTEEEFVTFRNIKNSGKDVELCFYRCTREGGLDVNNNDSLRQREYINNFFADNNNKVFSATPYQDIPGFESRFRLDIKNKIESLLKINMTSPAVNNILRSFNVNGITQLYTPELNEKRNFDKIDFLENEDGDIYLLAHSGNSYLKPAESGNAGRFFVYMKNRLLKRPSKVKILLLNPYSLEARKIYYAENFSLYQSDITSISEKSLKLGKNYKRFKDCLNGIREIQEELGRNANKIEVRILNVATDGTILMSHSRLFFEPYISSRFLNRIERGLNVFEIQVKNLLHNKQCPSIFNRQFCKDCEDRIICSENLYKTIAEQFHILWTTAISLPEYNGQVHKYKDDFIKKQPDLFFRQLIQLHDSWYAFDPIIGCSGNCVYCFLGPQGWKNSSPELRNKPKEDPDAFLNNAYKSLNEYKFIDNNGSGRDSLGIIPISVGNKTDMMSSVNHEYLKIILDLHEAGNSKRPVVLITKQLLEQKLIELLSKYSFDIYIFYSIAFLPKQIEPFVPVYSMRLNSAEAAKNIIDKNGITNIHLIHYWRPIVNLMSEKIDDIFIKIKSVFKCSVCIGLKLNSEIYDSIKSDAESLYNYIESRPEKDNIDNGIEIFDPSLETLKSLAKKHNYPIFQHTSCAISYIQKKADFNGSMWRDGFCNDCVAEQQKICGSFKNNWDIDNYRSVLESNVGAHYKVMDDCIKIINLSVSQEKLNYMTHLVGRPVFSESVRFSLVWPSGNQIYYLNKYARQQDVYEIIKKEYPYLTQQLNRLKGITGFVSILGDDKRVEVFNRYNHVIRVNRLLEWYIKDMEDFDHKKCVFIGLFHDINRLPFAHNLEKHIKFSQADTLKQCMSLFNTQIDDSYYKEFHAFFSKDLNFSAESRIAFLIDCVEGFFEDTLFAFVTLNFNYKDVPEEILSVLGYKDNTKLESQISRLHNLYISDTNHFTKEFDAVVFEYAKEFISQNISDKKTMFKNEFFTGIRKKIKDKVMIEKIFPLNNIKVSKGGLISNDLGEPYIKYLKDKNIDPLVKLFTQTDKSMLDDSIINGLVKEEDRSKYYPALIN